MKTYDMNARKGTTTVWIDIRSLEDLRQSLFDMLGSGSAVALLDSIISDAYTAVDLETPDVYTG